MKFYSQKSNFGPFLPRNSRKSEFLDKNPSVSPKKKLSFENSEFWVALSFAPNGQKKSLRIMSIVRNKISTNTYVRLNSYERNDVVSLTKLLEAFV